MTLKYVIVRRYGQEFPIVFPELYKHSLMVEDRKFVVSAGFFVDGIAFGESESLGVGSRLIDTALIRTWLLGTN